MTIDQDDDKRAHPAHSGAGGKQSAAPGSDRYIYGPRALGAVLPSVVRPAYKRRSPASAQILIDWEVIVGPAIAAVTTPRKLFSGTLSIVCPGPVAMELQHLSDAVIGRINSHFGRTMVTRLRFIQDITAQPPPPPRPRPQAMRAARNAVESLPEGELREALERLGRFVLTDRAR
jgi:hypothetical protein